MGHTTKKKKRGGGRKGKGRAPSSDHCTGDDQDLLSEELTALSAIFQEDFRILSEAPEAHFVIDIRPRSDDGGDDNPDVVASLAVRCLPGYPYKCPKLQIVPEVDLKQEDLERLLSLLNDQANSNAREGRVMIFNLIEAAQEFLSEVIPIEELNESVSSADLTKTDEHSQGLEPAMHSSRENPEGPFVYGIYDLFSELCGGDGSWDKGLGPDVLPNQQIKAARELRSENALNAYGIDRRAPQSVLGTSSRSTFTAPTKNGQTLPSLPRLNVLQEIEENSQSLSSKSSATFSDEAPSENDSVDKEHEGQLAKDLFVQATRDSASTDLGNQAFKREKDDRTHSKKNDVLMAYLLRLACSTKGSLTLALPEIAAELYSTGILSERAKVLALEPAMEFNQNFNNAFEQEMISSTISQFWRASIDSEENASAINSRYLNDFEEIRSIGHGGFGHVVLCKNKLDERHYAVKKIRLKSKSSPFNEKILREVATLSRLQHQHVVRYYQAWFETQIGFQNRESSYGSITAESSGSYLESSKTSDVNTQNKQESTFLYIQMEYCPRTLRQDFEEPKRYVDKELTWHLFRQIVEGLAHIHSQGIIHRDLTPNNIFFGSRNDIKIGDFGLAKFLRLEQLDQDVLLPTENIGASNEGTGQVGTYYYTAPEIEQGWPQINEKADMYSLGVVFFELWHPFDTAMERHVILSDLKLKGLLPPRWSAEFPEQSSLVQLLLSSSPSDRPSAKELLRSALPPRMEDEWLNDILRTIQTSEDTYVYDQVIATIFDEERVNLKAQRLHSDRSKLNGDSSFLEYTEMDTEYRDTVTEVTKEVFRKHGARRLETSPMRVLDGHYQFNRKAVRLLSSGGNILELCHEIRFPFIEWVIKEEKLSFKRYEVSWVHRRAIGHSTPNRFLQGDFDIVGGAPAVSAAEAVKVALDIASHFFQSGYFYISLNHSKILAAIWSWVGVEASFRQDVAEVLSSLSLYPPQSAERKGHWTFIRRQLLQGLNLSKTVVDRLQTVDSRFCGSSDKSLARLRGALCGDKCTSKAFEEIAVLLNCLRVWKIEKSISIDVLMPPEENYDRGLFFQVYLVIRNSFGSTNDRSLFASGGSYDHLLQAMWVHKSSPPSAVGISLALEKIARMPSVDIKPSRHEPGSAVLVCSKGGGGLLDERMEIVAELWEANIKADFVPIPMCSLTMQYDYAGEHDIKLLIIIEAGLSQTGILKVRNLELKKEKKVERASLIKFVAEAVSTQFRSLSIWN